jgi:23S rRNA (adenine2030-N6)-methyltransferase
MNYRHVYHAGNFADVFKHVVLITILQSLLQKEKAFCYLETNEFNSGIEQIKRVTKLHTENEIPSEISHYLKVVECFSDDSHFYPGSPSIASYFLRPQDRMILSELHPYDVGLLKQVFNNNKQVAVHQLDGYQALKAFLPPLERRGLVLIDPPYEQENELECIHVGLQTALKKWETGIYAIWYPVKEKYFINNMHYLLKSLNAKKMITAELCIYSDEDSSNPLKGCGMTIINSPWQLEKRLNILLPWLWHALSQEKAGGFQIQG